MPFNIANKTLPLTVTSQPHLYVSPQQQQNMVFPYESSQLCCSVDSQ